MKINIINDKENCKFLVLEFLFPTFGKISSFNIWSDESFSGFKISFPTKIYYMSDTRVYWHFELTLLGFGAKITHQHGY